MVHNHTGHGHQHGGHNHGGHGHQHGGNYNRAFVIGLALNLGFVVVEFVYGLLANSIALIADAGHNLSDVLGLVLAWGASLLSRRKPSRLHTYGWRRSSILAAFLNAASLLVVTGGIAWEAIQRFRDPGPVAGHTIIGVAAVGVVINTVTAVLFMSGRKSDLNIRAAFLHMATDAMVSFGVVLAGIIILFTRWLWLDPAFSLAISGVIIVNTWQLLKDSFNLAIDAVPKWINEPDVRTYLAERPGIAQVHDLHIWAMSTTEAALTAHLVMPGGHPSDAFLSQVCQELHDRFGIEHSTLQVETGDPDHPCTLASDHRV